MAKWYYDFGEHPPAIIEDSSLGVYVGVPRYGFVDTENSIVRYCLYHAANYYYVVNDENCDNLSSQQLQMVLSSVDLSDYYEEY